MSNIKQIYFRPLVFLFILILDFGMPQEYNWSANFRFRARTDKNSSVDWQKTFATITETRSRLGLDILGEYASCSFWPAGRHRPSPRDHSSGNVRSGGPGRLRVRREQACKVGQESFSLPVARLDA